MAPVAVVTRAPIRTEIGTVIGGYIDPRATEGEAESEAKARRVGIGVWIGVRERNDAC